LTAGDHFGLPAFFPKRKDKGSDKLTSPECVVAIATEEVDGGSQQCATEIRGPYTRIVLYIFEIPYGTNDSKVTGPEITHLRAETEFWEGEAS